ncbi:hypothetical protein ACQP60_16885 [Isoptericola variabilis]|uniref:hypothetical protein n=1 Tax=Isoptericola variabilis TaxID=139208 RepID=UPI003D239BCC
MEPVLSRPVRGRAPALVATLALILAPLLAAPASASTEPVVEPSATTEPTDGPTDPTTEPTEPVDVTAPDAALLVLDGTPRVGQELSLDPQSALWEPEGVALDFTYRWFTDDVEVEGAQDDSLVLTPAMLGSTVSVEVTGKAPEGAVGGEPSDSVVVTAVDAVASGAFVTAALQVTGDARVGQTLTVTADTWTPAVDLAFEWRRGDVVVGQGSTYVPGPADVGSALTVVASGEAQGYLPANVTATTGTVVAGTLSGATPTVTGTVQVGRTVTAVPGTWAPADAALSYQWLRSGTPISRATSPTYTLTAADAGKALQVTVTGTVEGYAPVSRTSAARTVANATLTTATPTLSGTVRVGSKVTARAGTWTSGATLTYQWYASGKAISGATTSAYTPTASVKGKSLSVRVTGKKAGYTSVTRSSAGKTVGAGVFSAPAPKISGTVRVGNKVSVTRGTWKPSATTYRYQWRVNGVKITGATKSSYTIPSKYAGKNLTVTVTGSRAGYTTKSVTSASSKVLRVYSRTSAPKVSGTARVGSTLKVSSRGTWTPTPSSWKYQWKANGTAIKGATGSSFKLTGAQYGKRITVTIKGVRSGYYPTSRTSAATAAVGAPAAVLTKDGTYRVGTQIKPGTYITSGSSAGCYFERRSTAGSSLSGIIANSITFGQTIVTIKSTDKYFVTDGCGTWRKYYAYGSVRTSTAADGIYRVGTSGGQLKPGLYYTSGSSDGTGCYVASMSSFSAELDSILDNDFFDGPGYWQVLASDTAFETAGCVWRRVSS